MKILNLELSNFRNYKYLYYNPKGQINVITGENAMGKTNLLEAIYVLTVGKSFRTVKDSELIQIGGEQTNLKALSINFEYEDYLDVNIYKDKKNKYSINSDDMNLSKYRRDFSSVIFSPSDLNMVKFSPSERRKYLDSLILKLSSVYEHNLYRYRKIIFERNKLLKKNINYDLLEVYDFQLAKYGVKILRERLKILKEFENYVKYHFSNLSGGENLKITYLSTIPLMSDEEEMEKIFLDSLKNCRKRDLEIKFTTIGPHRDDIDFKIENLSAKTYGSQGEIRTVVLSLKLSEVDIIKNYQKNSPLLLLDDVFSELDKNRASYLINSLKNMQTFITSTNLNEENFRSLNADFYEIKNGQIINY
ncbi:DNA replication/repair protein RecF [Peptoniphilus mikwangii]|uniref:DNA replication/repair protein RecF n=1 Tax=Peptoniphilus mikwangii TaxID=1354300 RepID=UPI0003F7F673|nr:DNA replication/repair protein RecF [Peptoniphilus mikwangii]